MLKRLILFFVLVLTLSKEGMSTAAVENVIKNVTITISAIGDCTIGSFPEVTKGKSFFDVFNNKGKDYNYFFKNAVALKKDDLSIINLEGTFTKSTNKAIKKWRFKSDPKFVNVLKKADIEAVTISNNHIYDYGIQGFEDTVSTLKKANISTIGEHNKPIFKVKGRKIALLAYNALTTFNSTEKEMKEDLKAIPKDVNLVIVSFHWGVEYSTYPIVNQQKLAREAIDLGADLVLGTHPHILQGIEYYKNRYIVYSLGNFVFGGNEIMDDKKHKDIDSMLFSQSFTFIGDDFIPEECKIIPYKQSGDSKYNDYCPVELGEIEGSRVIDKLIKISKNLEFGVKSLKW